MGKRATKGMLARASLPLRPRAGASDEGRPSEAEASTSDQGHDRPLAPPPSTVPDKKVEKPVKQMRVEARAATQFGQDGCEHCASAQHNAISCDATISDRDVGLEWQLAVCLLAATAENTLQHPHSSSAGGRFVLRVDHNHCW